MEFRPGRRSHSLARAARRAGLTLFELLLALAILLVSLAALAHLFASGGRAATQARLKTHAIMRCDSVLAEIAAGVHPLENTPNAVEPGDPRWSWSVSLQDGPWAGLKLVAVTVSYQAGEAPPVAIHTLRRYVREPRSFAQEDAAREDAARAARLAAPQARRPETGPPQSPEDLDP